MVLSNKLSYGEGGDYQADTDCGEQEQFQVEGAQAAPQGDVEPEHRCQNDEMASIKPIRIPGRALPIRISAGHAALPTAG